MLRAKGIYLSGKNQQEIEVNKLLSEGASSSYKGYSQEEELDEEYIAWKKKWQIYSLMLMQFRKYMDIIQGSRQLSLNILHQQQFLEDKVKKESLYFHPSYQMFMHIRE